MYLERNCPTVDVELIEANDRNFLPKLYRKTTIEKGVKQTRLDAFLLFKLTKYFKDNVCSNNVAKKTFYLSKYRHIGLTIIGKKRK